MRILINLWSERERNFGGNFEITKVIARTDADRPHFKTYVEICGDLRKNHWDEQNKMKSLKILVEPDVLTHCLNVFQSDLNSKIEEFEKKLSTSQHQQIKSGMMLIASRLALLVEGDPRWRELATLISQDDEVEFGSAAQLAAEARSAIDAATPKTDDITVEIGSSEGQTTADALMERITDALEIAMQARHARALIVELQEFFERFSIPLGAR